MNTTTTVTHELGEQQPFIFPYKAKEYPFLMYFQLRHPLTHAKASYLFELFPKALIIGADIVVPRTREDITKPIQSALDELECFGIVGINVIHNMYK